MAGTAAPAAAAPSRDAEKAADFHDDAVRLMQRGDLRAAMIQLRNAVQLDPDNLSYRRVLGEVYLRLGDAPSAAKELSRAQDRRPDDRAEVMLGEALLMQGKAEEVLDAVEISAAEPELRRQEAMLRGSALYQLGRLDDAAAMFGAAAADGFHAPAELGLARIDLSRRQGEAAQARVDKVLAEQPDNVEALLITATLADQDMRLGDALAALERAKSVAPDDIRVDLANIQLMVRGGRAEDAEALSAELEQARPDQPLVKYARALALASVGRFAEADRALVAIEDRLPPLPDALLMAANIKMNTQQASQAERYLLRYLAMAPGDERVLRALATMHLKNGKPDAAIFALEPHAGTAGPETLRLLASAYLRQGLTDKAAETFERIADAGDRRAAREAEASLDLLTGSNAEAGPDGDRLLKSADLLRSGDVQGALAIIRQLRTQAPDNALYADLEGRVHARNGDLGKAAEAFRAALEIQPDHANALAALVQITLRTQDQAAAEQLVRDHLATGGPRASILLADLLNRRGAVDEADAILTRTAADHPAELEPRVALLGLQLQRSDRQAVVATANRMTADFPDDARAVRTAAEAMANVGEETAALDLMARLTAMAPDDAQAFAVRARSMAKLGDTEGGLKLLTGFDERVPGTLPVLAALADLNLMAGDPEKARAAAARMAAHDAVAAGRIEARILSRSNRLPEAIALLEKLHKETPNGDLAADIYAARMSARQPAEALKALTDWVAREPMDRRARQLLAGHYLNAGDMVNAEAEYRRLVAAYPNDAIALNNLAWISNQRGGADALALARRAVELAPNAPQVLDTLGVILVNRGEMKEGTEMLRKAAELAPTSPDIQLSFARALITGGDRDQARAVLKTVMSTAGDEVPEAKKLLAEIERP